MSSGFSHVGDLCSLRMARWKSTTSRRLVTIFK